jgi:hypothetical protein
MPDQKTTRATLNTGSWIASLVARLKISSQLIIIWLVVIQCAPDKNNVGTTLGKVDARLQEASGLTASVANPSMFWVVSDSDNPSEVFLIDQHAKTRMVCKLQVPNRDWEDIAIGAGPDPKKKYIYVADIGDNWGQYEYKIIYRFEEPTLHAQTEMTIAQIDKLVLRMPDGSRDAETILIDPFDNDLFLISKREDSVGVYTVPYPFHKDTLTLRKVMKLPLSKIVAGSITLEGNEILLKDYTKVYYWKRSGEESLPEALSRKPIELPYKREYQGEAIAWSNKGNEFFTLSEAPMGSSGELLVYKMKK